MVEIIIDVLVATLVMGFWVGLGFVCLALLNTIYAFVVWFIEKMK
jgi:hypothetical protein